MHVETNVVDRTLTRLVYWQGRPGVGHLARLVLNLVGVQIPRAVRIGPGLRLMHAPAGIVVHAGTTIGRDVTLLHNSTIGRADPWDPGNTAIEIGDDVMVCAGAVILGPNGGRRVVARGTVVGANAVLTCDTGPNEIWAGQPARMIGRRRTGR